MRDDEAAAQITRQYRRPCEAEADVSHLSTGLIGGISFAGSSEHLAAGKCRHFALKLSWPNRRAHPIKRRLNIIGTHQIIC